MINISMINISASWAKSIARFFNAGLLYSSIILWGIGISFMVLYFILDLLLALFIAYFADYFKPSDKEAAYDVVFDEDGNILYRWR